MSFRAPAWRGEPMEEIVRWTSPVIQFCRTPVEDFEEFIGAVLSEEERDEDIDTLGGLVTYLAGHVPSRGELIEHPASGITFEVLQADPRRVRRLRLRDLPARPEEAAEA